MNIRIADWIAAQPEPRPSRTEAIKHLLAEALANEAARVAAAGVATKASNSDK